MLRAGVSLPALKELLGHKSLRMTLVYVQVTQDDLQREFHAARLKLEAHRLPLPLLPVTGELNNDPGMTGLFQSMATSRHLLEMYRRQLTEGKLRRKLERLANRLHKVSAELEKLLPEENEQRLAGQGDTQRTKIPTPRPERREKNRIFGLDLRAGNSY